MTTGNRSSLCNENETTIRHTKTMAYGEMKNRFSAFLHFLYRNESLKWIKCNISSAGNCLLPPAPNPIRMVLLLSLPLYLLCLIASDLRFKHSYSICHLCQMENLFVVHGMKYGSPHTHPTSNIHTVLLGTTLFISHFNFFFSFACARFHFIFWSWHNMRPA